jgi:hypothetical protein
LQERRSSKENTYLCKRKSTQTNGDITWYWTGSVLSVALCAYPPGFGGSLDLLEGFPYLHRKSYAIEELNFMNIFQTQRGSANRLEQRTLEAMQLLLKRQHQCYQLSAISYLAFSISIGILSVAYFVFLQSFLLLFEANM